MVRNYITSVLLDLLLGVLNKCDAITRVVKGNSRVATLNFFFCVIYARMNERLPACYSCILQHNPVRRRITMRVKPQYEMQKIATEKICNLLSPLTVGRQKQCRQED